MVPAGYRSCSPVLKAVKASGTMTLPAPEEPDVERLIKTSAKYGFTYPPPPGG